MRTLCAFVLLFLFFLTPKISYSHGGKGKEPPLLDGEPSPTFYEILDERWQELMTEYPEWATDLGYPGKNDKWMDMSFEAYDRRVVETKEFIKLLHFGNRKEYLDEQGKFDFDVVMHSASDDIESYQFYEEYLPISQLSGIQQDMPYQLASQPHHGLQASRAR